MNKNQTPPREIPNTPDPGEVNPEKDPDLEPDHDNPINPKNDEPG